MVSDEQFDKHMKISGQIGRILGIIDAMKQTPLNTLSYSVLFKELENEMERLKEMWLTIA